MCEFFKAIRYMFFRKVLPSIKQNPELMKAEEERIIEILKQMWLSRDALNSKEVQEFRRQGFQAYNNLEMCRKRMRELGAKMLEGKEGKEKEFLEKWLENQIGNNPFEAYKTGKYENDNIASVLLKEVKDES